MMTVILRRWRYLVLRGVLSVLFGMAALVFPWAVLRALVFLFGAYALVDGLIAIMFGIGVRGKNQVWVLLIEGALGVLVGIVTFLWPDTMAMLLLYLIASWAILTGVLEIAAMNWLRRVGAAGGLVLALSGVFSVALGVALFFAPQVGLVALACLLGGYALAFGALFIWLGLLFRRQHLARGGIGVSDASSLVGP